MEKGLKMMPCQGPFTLANFAVIFFNACDQRVDEFNMK
jgi:hypothetical protein